MAIAGFALWCSIRLLRGEKLMTGIGALRKATCSEMRHRILVQQATTTLDSSRQPIITYTTRYANEPASFKQVTRGEKIRGRQMEEAVNAVFEVNYRDGYTVTDRIFFQGNYYGIVGIDNPDGVNRFTVLYCSA